MVKLKIAASIFVLISVFIIIYAFTGYRTDDVSKNLEVSKPVDTDLQAQDNQKFIQYLLAQSNEFIKSGFYQDAILNLHMILEIEPENNIAKANLSKIQGFINNSELVSDNRTQAFEDMQMKIDEAHKLFDDGDFRAAYIILKDVMAQGNSSSNQSVNDLFAKTQIEIQNLARPMIIKSTNLINESKKMINDDEKAALTIAAAEEIAKAMKISPDDKDIQSRYRQLLGEVDAALDYLTIKADTLSELEGCQKSASVYEALLEKNPFKESKSYIHAQKEASRCKDLSSQRY